MWREPSLVDGKCLHPIANATKTSSFRNRNWLFFSIEHYVYVCGRGALDLRWVTQNNKKQLLPNINYNVRRVLCMLPRIVSDARACGPVVASCASKIKRNEKTPTTCASLTSTTHQFRWCLNKISIWSRNVDSWTIWWWVIGVSVNVNTPDTLFLWKDTDGR